MRRRRRRRTNGGGSGLVAHGHLLVKILSLKKLKNPSNVFVLSQLDATLQTVN